MLSFIFKFGIIRKNYQDYRVIFLGKNKSFLIHQGAWSYNLRWCSDIFDPPFSSCTQYDVIVTTYLRPCTCIWATPPLGCGHTKSMPLTKNPFESDFASYRRRFLRHSICKTRSAETHNTVGRVFFSPKLLWPLLFFFG